MELKNFHLIHDINHSTNEKPDPHMKWYVELVISNVNFVILKNYLIHT